MVNDLIWFSFVYRAQTALLSKDKRDDEALTLFLHLHNTTDWSNLTSKGAKRVQPNQDRMKLKIKGADTIVCQRVFYEGHGFTEHEWKKAKKNAMNIAHRIPTASVTASASSTHTPYDDDHIPQFTLAEAEEIMKNNVPGFTRDMPRCAINPKADR